MNLKYSIIISIFIFSLAISCQPKKRECEIEIEEPQKPPCPNLVGSGVYSIKSIRINDEPRKMKQWVDCYGEIHSEILPIDYE